MASPNLVSYDLKGVKESFANWISNLSPTETPFTSMTGKEAIKNKYFQWQEDSLNSAVSNAVAEGSEAGVAAQKATSIQHNVTQILRKVCQVSDTANALSSYGRGKEMQYQMEKASKELKRDIEYAFLNNDAIVDGNGNTARKMGGFPALVANVDEESPELNGSIVHISGEVTEENIFAVTEGLYLAGAKPTHIMFHPKFAKFFSSLMEVKGANGNRQRMFDGSVDNKVNVYVSEMVDPLGQRFVLLPNRFMPETAIYFFNPSDWTQMVLRTPGAMQLAKEGSFDKYMIEIELGLRHRNRFASGILDVTTAAPSTITAGTAPADFKVGDADIPVETLFNIPAGKTVADYNFTSGTTANATIVSGKVHAVKAGTSVITATNKTEATDTANLTITVKAAAPTPATDIALAANAAVTGVTVSNTAIAGLEADASNQVVVKVTGTGGTAPITKPVVAATGADAAKLDASIATVTGSGTSASPYIFTVKAAATGVTAADTATFTVTSGTLPVKTVTVTFA